MRSAGVSCIMHDMCRVGRYSATPSVTHSVPYGSSIIDRLPSDGPLCACSHTCQPLVSRVIWTPSAGGGGGGERFEKGYKSCMCPPPGPCVGFHGRLTDRPLVTCSGGRGVNPFVWERLNPSAGVFVSRRRKQGGKRRRREACCLPRSLCPRRMKLKSEAEGEPASTQLLQVENTVTRQALIVVL